MYIFGLEPNEKRMHDYYGEQLAYWRKHPDLHGYIVKTFAAGSDECQAVGLSPDDLQSIVDAIVQKRLPYTSGPFFGVSTEEDTACSIAQLESVKEWLEKVPGRTIYYQASW